MKPTHSPQRRRLLQGMSAGVPAAIGVPVVCAGRNAISGALATDFVLYHRAASEVHYRRWDGMAATAGNRMLEVEMHALGGLDVMPAFAWSVDAMLATPDAPPSAFTVWRHVGARPDAGSRSTRFVTSARQWRGVRLRFRAGDGEPEQVQYLPMVQEGSASLAEGDYMLLRLPVHQQHETLDPAGLRACHISAALAFQVRTLEEPLAEMPRADLAAIRAAHAPVDHLA